MHDPDKATDKPAKPAAEPVSIGPKAGDGPGAGTMLIQLVGGPRHGWQERVPVDTERVNIHHGDEMHDYAKGANLPADFASRTPPQGGAVTHFGYVGPDQEAVARLIREHEGGGGDVKRGPEHGPATGEAKGKPAKPLTTENYPG
jgi:hypothetical protein